MKNPRIYADLPLILNEEVTLCGEQHHYLVHVLRLEVNDSVNLFNRNGEFLCRLLAIERHASYLLCEQAVASLPVSCLKMTLYVSLSKSRSMDFSMQKATELGVTAVQPVIATRSIVVPRSSQSWERKLAHWRSISRSACEQCGRIDVPEIIEPVPFEKIEIPRDAVSFILSPQSNRSLYSAVGSLSTFHVATLLGPEGGLTEDEEQTAQTKGFIPVSLGPRLLRVETAVTASLSILQAFLGDLAGESSDS